MHVLKRLRHGQEFCREAQCSALVSTIIARLRNDLLCVEWDVKPYTLTHPTMIATRQYYFLGTTNKKISNNTSASYFQNHMLVFSEVIRRDSRALRSAGSNRLQIPPFKLSTVGGRAFPVAAARFWNRLPDNVTLANSVRCRLFSSN